MATSSTTGLTLEGKIFMVLINSTLWLFVSFCFQQTFPPRFQQASPLLRDGVAQPDDRDIYILNTILDNIKHRIKISIIYINFTTTQERRGSTRWPRTSSRRRWGGVYGCTQRFLWRRFVFLIFVFVFSYILCISGSPTCEGTDSNYTQ